MIARLKLVEPCNENRQVAEDQVIDARIMPLRQPNADLRSREYLTPAEIEKLIKAAKDGRWGQRDACLIIVAYRHGLRAKEACELEWSQVEFGRSASLHVRRAKKGKPAVHPIRGDELRMLRALRKEYPDSGYVFTSERGTPFTPDAINRLVKIIGKRADIGIETSIRTDGQGSRPGVFAGRICGGIRSTSQQRSSEAHPFITVGY